MNTFELEQLSEKDMEQIKGGGWIQVDGRWYWIEKYDLGEDDNGSV